MVSEMIRPMVVSFLDLMLRERERVLRFEEILVKTGSPLIGRNLRDVRLGERSGALLVALRSRGKDDYEFNPPAETEIQDHDLLIFIASPDMMKEVEKLVESG